MSANVQIFSHSIPEISYIARTSTKGDEIDMVNLYIKYLVEKYSGLKTKHIAIFLEPQIDTGYPDIVIVEYWGQVKSEWNSSRSNLSFADLKILFQITQQRNVSIDSLSILLGFSNADIQKSFLRLSESNLIHLSKSKHHARNIPIRSFSNIKKIISIEAKIDKWTEAIHQASKNTWFSTESFVLLNKEKCSESIIKKCEEHGVGIILVNGRIQTILKSELRNYPISYTSLLFNEWIHRANYLEEMNDNSRVEGQI